MFSPLTSFSGPDTNQCFRLLCDAEHLHTKFSKIEGSGDLGEHITTLVKEKSVAPPPEAPKTPEAPVIARTSTEKQRPETENNEEKPDATPAVS